MMQETVMNRVVDTKEPRINKWFIYRSDLRQIQSRPIE